MSSASSFLMPRIHLIISRYVNVDFIFCMIMIRFILLMYVITYDIACQWSKKLDTRLQKTKLGRQATRGQKLVFKVPKFHLPCHQEECWGPYSLNYQPGVGQTDGEGIERNWAWLNLLARSLSVMTFGSRADTLDDVCNFWNWARMVNLCKLFRLTDTLDDTTERSNRRSTL
jgi:hypothetical protein